MCVLRSFIHGPAEKNCLTENVPSLRSARGAALPCDAKASIPCVLAVRKQHKMLFAASKFDSNKSKFMEAFEWLMNQKALSESGWIILKA